MQDLGDKFIKPDRILQELLNKRAVKGLWVLLDVSFGKFRRQK